MLKQRVYGIALGYEDLNDNDTLRNDLALQIAVDSESQLASHSTLSRLENKANRQWAWAIHQELFQQFVKSFKTPTGEKSGLGELTVEIPSAYPTTHRSPESCLLS